jgi:hypothetical protein
MGSGYGVYVDNFSVNNVITNTTTDNTGYGVFFVEQSNNNTLSNITTTGSGQGLTITSTSGHTLENIVTADNTNYGIVISNTANNYFTGLLKVGSNTTLDCFLTGTNTNPGINSDCSPQNISDHTLTTGVTTTTSFVGGSDYSLLGTDSVLREVLSLPAGDDIVTHTWSDMSTTNMLRNAVELLNDGSGNDNLLCESGETCLFTPNIAAYQGHGNLISAGTFTDGMLTNITLLRYENNGY